MMVIYPSLVGVCEIACLPRLRASVPNTPSCRACLCALLALIFTCLTHAPLNVTKYLIKGNFKAWNKRWNIVE